MVHDNMGTGFPMVSHDKVSLSPSLIQEFHKKKLTNQGIYSTSSKAALEVAFPISLLATHRYCPLSVLFTYVIVNVLLSAPKVILGSAFVFIIEPCLLHDIVSGGSPVALQDKVTLSPSLVVAFCGCVVISGEPAACVNCKTGNKSKNLVKTILKPYKKVFFAQEYVSFKFPSVFALMA